MKIKTIADLKRASPVQIETAKLSAKLIKDLQIYLLWLKSSQGRPVEGQFSLGYKERSLGIHPSTVSKADFCKLQAYYEVTGEVLPEKQGDPEKFAKLELTFDTGTMVHLMFQAFFKDMYGERFKDEVSLKDKNLRISSHTDGTLELQNIRTVLEIKSIKEGGGFGVDTIRAKPMLDHVRQSHYYMALSDIPFCNVFYFCKNTSEVIEHVIEFVPELWDELLAEIEPVLESVDKGKEPKANVGFHCRSCRYLHGCVKGQNYVHKRQRIRNRGSSRS